MTNPIEAAAKAFWEARERTLPEAARRKWSDLIKTAPELRTQWLDATGQAIRAYRKAGGT